MRIFTLSRLLLFIIFLFIYQCILAQTAEEEAQEMLELVNEIRAARGIPLLRLNTELNKAAYDHSDDMARNNYFSHTGLNGSNFSQRIQATGYNGSPRGENIAAGNSSVVNTFNQWLNSEGHLNNMLNRNSDEMGIGHASFNGSRYTHYWTQVFGKSNQTLSNNEEVAIKNLKIYPNPVKDILNLNFKEPFGDQVQIKLMSVTGQIVFQQLNDRNISEMKLNIGHLPTGIYFLYFKNSNIRKIVKY